MQGVICIIFYQMFDLVDFNVKNSFNPSRGMQLQLLGKKKFQLQDLQLSQANNFGHMTT